MSKKGRPVRPTQKCENCNGTGKVGEYKCQQCNGKGRVY